MCLYSIYTLYAFNTLCVFSTSSVCIQHFCIEDFPGGSDGKASAYNVGDQGSIPGLGRPWGWSSPTGSTPVLIFVWILVPRWLVSSSSLSLTSCWPWFCSLRMSSCQEVHGLPGKLIPGNFIPGILQTCPGLAEFQMK